MELHSFIDNFKEQLEDTDVTVTEDTKFKDMDSWDSLTRMMVIGMVKTEYDKDITNIEIEKCDTVADLYNLVKS